MNRLLVRSTIVVSIVFVLAAVYLKLFGVQMKTSTDALVLPATVSSNSEQTVSSIRLGITPAPWPSEAKWIYRLASFGIPVHVTMGQVKFTIEGVDSEGDLLVRPPDSHTREELTKVLGLTRN